MVLPDNQLTLLLLQSGIVNEDTLRTGLEFARNSQTTLQDALIEKDLVSDETIGKVIANSFKVPFVTLSKMSIPEDVVRIVPERIARKFNVIAFARATDGIKVAMTNPRNTDLITLLSKKTRQHITPYLATERDIASTLHNYRRDLQKTFDELLKEAIGSNALTSDDAPIAKIVDLLITYAYQDKTSDVHIEPQEENSLVRFRIDGILHDVLKFDKKLHERILTRIKVLSRLRTDEHLSAQDGKMRIQLPEENLDIRVSIIPIAEGEKVVMRLLASHFRQFSLLDLGMNEKDLKKVNAAISKSYGMILSTGPTGSGKTTSIYAILKLLNTREKNITTIEDPIEYRIKGVNQIQVNVKTNLTFANGLRSILRQDPNVIFVGEIRDNETAGIAVNAALTGHLVLSTLHTNDAATALPRLVDMGVEPFLVASTVNIIVAQRLVRKVCESCKVPIRIKREELIKNLPQDAVERHFPTQGDVQLYQGSGCKVCHNSGYTGRIGIFEVIEMTPTIKQLITQKSESDVIVKQAVAEGMTTMLDDGLQKTKLGLTTIAEVLRVTKVESL